MRGALHTVHDGLAGKRIIPADAGSTFRPGSPVSCRPDHPRRCGEHRLGLPEISPRGGSSPQMRGAQLCGAGRQCDLRIIPADAESTGGKKLSNAIGQDHPRRCGEHIGVRKREAPAKGSSPQMRGAPRAGLTWPSAHRIIPADAESTSPCSNPTPGRKDHPRRCGEHPNTSQRMAIKRGSSPQMRGALHQPRHALGRVRIIPADAGSTHPGFRRKAPS